MNPLSVWLGLFGITALWWGWSAVRESGGVRPTDTMRQWRETFGGSTETRRAKRMQAPIGFILGIGFLALAVFVFLRPPQENDSLSFLSDNDPRLLEATYKAKRDLPLFLQLWDKRMETPGYTFDLKRDFVDGPTHEHMWFDLQTYDGQTFTGALADIPTEVSNIQQGDLVEATTNDVEDWSVWDEQGNLVAGGFLYQALQ